MSIQLTERTSFIMVNKSNSRKKPIPRSAKYLLSAIEKTKKRSFVNSYFSHLHQHHVLKMSLEITYGELFDYIVEKGALPSHTSAYSKTNQYRRRFKTVAEQLKAEKHLTNDVYNIQLALTQIYSTKHKTEEWRSRVKCFQTERNEDTRKRGRTASVNQSIPSKKGGRPCLHLSDSPCERVESNLLKDSLSVVASTAEENGISKEEMLKKMVLEACRSKDWDMSDLIESLNPQPVIPIADLTAFLYVANLSQRQY